VFAAWQTILARRRQRALRISSGFGSYEDLLRTKLAVSRGRSINQAQITLPLQVKTTTAPRVHQLMHTVSGLIMPPLDQRICTEDCCAQVEMEVTDCLFQQNYGGKD
jgi:hypothetical protein